MSMAGEGETQLQAAATAPPGVRHRSFRSSEARVLRSGKD